MTALLVLLLVFAVCGGIPGAYLYGRRVGRYMQTAEAFEDGYSLGVVEGHRRMSFVAMDAALKRITKEGP